MLLLPNIAVWRKEDTAAKSRNSIHTGKGEMSTDDCAVDAGTNSAARLAPLQELSPHALISWRLEGTRARRLERSPEDQKIPDVLAVKGKYRSDWCHG
jgi:hypothetical protein